MNASHLWLDTREKKELPISLYGKKAYNYLYGTEIVRTFEKNNHGNKSD